MRTFHKLKTINRIIENPFQTIGQRNYTLFQNYLFSYSLYTKIEYNSKLQSELEIIPSIEDFVAKEFNETHERTVGFDYYLGWISEDERERFELCMDRILKYESAFPLAESEYAFELTVNENIDLKDNFKIMLLRPGMFGFNSLAGIRAFLDGYFQFKNDYTLSLSEYEKRLIKMINKWKAKTNPEIQFDTWDRALAKEELGTTDFTNTFKWEIERFEQIIKEGTKIDLTPPVTAKE